MSKQSIVNSINHNIVILRKLADDMEKLKEKAESIKETSYGHLYFDGKFDRSSIGNQVKVVRFSLLEMMDKIYYRTR